MADNIDSLSIQITADVSSAESSIDRLIGKLSQLKTAVSSASNFQKVASGIKDIVDAAKGIDPDTGERLTGLAKGLDALSKAGSLSHLKGAGKIISEIAAAAAQVGADAGERLFNLAQGLNAFQGVDTQKLREVRDAIGQTSSGIGTGINAGRAQPSSGVAALGSGTGSSFGGLEVFKFIPDEIHDATNAFKEFGDEVRGTADVIETVFTDADYEAPMPDSHAMDDMADGADHAAEKGHRFGSVLQSLSNIAGNFKKRLSSATISVYDLARSIGSISFKGIKSALFDLPKYFGGQMIGNIVNATKKVGQFFNSIKRIATYRLIRTALRLITQGFTEGIKNLYAWSAAMDGRFAASMDRLATAFLYMKNSIAAMVSPLIEAVAPAVDFVIDKFVDLFNIVNQIFARLSGQTSYTAAKKVATQWDDTSKSIAGSAKKAAKEIKATILGFDEINRLNGDNGSGSGTGSGTGSGVDASSMFEQRTISSWIQELVDGGDFSMLGQYLATKINVALQDLDWTKIKGSALKIVNGIVTTINGFIKGINPETLGSTIAQVINTAMTTIDRFWSGVAWAEAGKKLRGAIVQFFKDVDVETAADALTGKFRSLVSFIYNAIPTKDSEWNIIGDKITRFVTRTINNIPWSTIGDIIGQLIVGALKVMTMLADNETLAHIAKGIKTAIEDACKQITQDDVAKWVGAVLKDVLSAVGVLMTIQLKIGDVTLSPLAILAFGVLAHALLAKMISSVFGTISVASAAKGLAYIAAISLAIDAAVRIADIVQDVKNGNGINAGKVAGVIAKILEGLGLVAVARGFTSAGLVSIGLGIAFELLAKDITDIINGGGVANITIESIAKVLADILIGAGAWLLSVNPVAGAIVLGIGVSLKLIVSNLTWGDVKENLLTATVPDSIEIKDGKFNMVVDAYGNFMMVPKSGNGVEVSGSGSGTKFTLASDIQGTVDAIVGSVNGKSYSGQNGTSLWALLFPGAQAETTVNVKANQYSQDWYDKNIAPLEAGVKQQPIEVPVNLVKSAASTVATLISSLFGGKKEKEQKIDVKTNLVKGDVSLLQQIEDTPLTVKIKLKKWEWTTMDKFLNTDVVHYASIGLVKSAWVEMNHFLELDKVYEAFIALRKSAWTTMTEFLDLIRVHTAMIGLSKSGWTSMKTFLTLDQAYEALIKLSKYGWKSVWDFVTGGKTPVVTVDVVLNNASGYKSVGDFARGKKSNSTINKNGVSAEDMPAVANMAMSAAGAAYMGGAVSGGDVYSPVSNNSTTYESNNYGSDPAVIAEEMGALAELMRQANDYLRQINEKEFSAEITTSSVNRAMQRTNRRAGTTIVAIG